jgi:hypothetical protein
MRETVDLPVAMEPVRPIMSMVVVYVDLDFCWFVWIEG